MKEKTLKYREKHNESRRLRRANDLKYRERCNKLARECWYINYHTNPKFNSKEKNRQWRMYHGIPNKSRILINIVNFFQRKKKSIKFFS